jgi:hypothetical protein
MTVLLRIVGAFWLGAILVLTLVAFAITWAWRGWSVASALLDPAGATFAGVVAVSVPGLGLLAFAHLRDRRRQVRR